MCLVKNLNAWEMIVAFPSREGGFVHVLFLSSAAACMETVMANEGNLRALTMLDAHGNEYSREIPSVTLSGIWLKEAGFRPETRLLSVVIRGMVIIVDLVYEARDGTLVAFFDSVTDSPRMHCHLLQAGITGQRLRY